jgi:long-chain acyl-CoA synthetase
LNFVARVAEAASTRRDRVAIEEVSGDVRRTTTYADLMARAGRWTSWLTARGIQRGDRVAILAENDAAWIAAYLGILHIGAVAVPLDTAYRAEQVAAVISNSGATLVIASARQLDTARRAAAPDPSRAPRVVTLSEAMDADATVSALADVSLDDAAVILYTSGTTADPKGVVLTHGNLTSETRAALAVIDCTDRDAILGVLPLFHSLAQVTNLLVPLSVGARVVFLETVSSSTLIGALQECGITIFACVPQFFYLIHQRVMSEIGRSTALRRLVFKILLGTNGWLRATTSWNPGRRWFGRVHRTLGREMRMLITGGSRFDPAIGRDLYAMGFTILNGYGLTETTGAATVQRPSDRFTTSVGQPLPGVDLRIADVETAGERGGDGESDGEILIRGPVVMREYFNRPDATAEALQDGWLHTGDLGRIDRDGRLYITGRKKEVIVLSSGKNLYPEEIEAHYRQSPFIKELCVLGVVPPGQPSAERLHAVIVPDDQALAERGVVNVRDLIRFELEGLSVSLPPHKRILTFDISLEPLPRTTTGKLRRHEIERHLEEASRPESASSSRPLTDEEHAWLADEKHAAALQIVASALGKTSVAPNENLELDLSLDSLERVELFAALEQHTGTKIPPEARAKIFTVRQLIDATGSATASFSSGSRGPAPARVAPALADSLSSRQPQAPPDRPIAWSTILSDPPAPDLVAGLRSEPLARALVLFGLTKVMVFIVGLSLRVRVTGREHLPAEGPYILAPNHQSFLDGFFLAAGLPFRHVRRLFFVGAAELFVTPLMRWLARTANIVPVDPDANLVAAMQAGAAGLRMKKILMLFPEGERSIDGRIRKFRRGAAILASELAVPVVPVAIDGLFSLWPRSRPFNWRGLLPWRAERTSLALGAPILIARGDDADGTARIQAAVEELYGGLRAERERTKR